MTKESLAPGWELYRTLLAVVREGSLSGAARALALTQPTVGRHIDALEAQLGVALFSRSQNGLQPTDAALTLVPHAAAMANAAEALVRAASGKAGEERGAVRVTASELIGIEVLTPLLAPFHQRHPQIAVELTLSSRTEDLLQREADIALRLFRPTQTALLARRLGSLGFGLHAHPAYLAAHPAPRTIEELSDHALIGFDSEALNRRMRGYGQPFTREDLAFRCDSYLAQQAALRAGSGIANCMFALARRDGLLRVLPELPATAVEVWLVMHESLRAIRRARLLYDFLAKQVGAYVAREGAARASPRRAGARRG